MSKLKSIIDELKEIIKRVNESLSELTGRNYDGMPLWALPMQIEGLDLFQSQLTKYENGTYEDELGTFTVGNVVTDDVNWFSSRNTVKPDERTIVNGVLTLNTIPAHLNYVNLSHGGVTKLKANEVVCLCGANAVIFPETVENYVYLYFRSPGSNDLKRGLYLPKVWKQSHSIWINASTILKDVNVKCPVNTEFTPIYLHAISMSAETMVGIFNNLKNVSGESGTYQIQVGSTNLAKLTTAQKNIAINKGWVLS